MQRIREMEYQITGSLKVRVILEKKNRAEIHRWEPRAQLFERGALTTEPDRKDTCKKQATITSGTWLTPTPRLRTPPQGAWACRQLPEESACEVTPFGRPSCLIWKFPVFVFLRHLIQMLCHCNSNAADESKIITWRERGISKGRRELWGWRGCALSWRWRWSHGCRLHMSERPQCGSSTCATYCLSIMTPQSYSEKPSQNHMTRL